ncbi:MAG: hypothetical protein IKA02_03490 [Clostridia bacterium]|nr:hypothetical protein [Clostridia bacterium]
MGKGKINMEDNVFASAFETIKTPICQISLVILLINLYTEIFPDPFLNVIGWMAIAVFIIDLVCMIYSIIKTSLDGEWNGTAIVSTILNILVLLFFVVFFFFPDTFLIFLNPLKINFDIYQIWWAGTCIALYNFVLGVISFPIDLISIFSGDGDY